MTTQRCFHYYEPEASTSVARRNLPHWEQPSVCFFLTFRLHDSLPTSVLVEWKERRREWLKAHRIDPDDVDWHSKLDELSKVDRAGFHQNFSKAMHQQLDAGHGECLLRRPEIREIVTGYLHHFDGERYLLGGYVVMPNHVHVIVECLGTTTLRSLCYSWKHFTAHEIHKRLNRVGSGRVWQEETFDHIVRSPEQFVRFRHYLAENPVKSRLAEDAYSLFLPEVNGYSEEQHP